MKFSGRPPLKEDQIKRSYIAEKLVEQEDFDKDNLVLIRKIEITAENEQEMEALGNLCRLMNEGCQGYEKFLDITLVDIPNAIEEM
jgi:hypothetical protein